MWRTCLLLCAALTIHVQAQDGVNYKLEIVDDPRQHGPSHYSQHGTGAATFFRCGRYWQGTPREVAWTQITELMMQFQDLAIPHVLFSMPIDEGSNSCRSSHRRRWIGTCPRDEEIKNPGNDNRYIEKLRSVCSATKFVNAECLMKRYLTLFQSFVAYLNQFLNYLKHVETRYATPGMLTIPQAVELFASEYERTFEIRSIGDSKCCEEAVARIATFSSQFRQRTLVLSNALMAAFLHSHIPPDEAPIGLNSAIYHPNVGNQRFKVLVWLLQNLEFKLIDGQQNRRLKVAEIGVYTGGTSAYILDHAPQVDLLSVDPWPRDQLYKDVRLMLARYGRRATVWRKTSQEAAERFNGIHRWRSLVRSREG